MMNISQWQSYIGFCAVVLFVLIDCASELLALRFIGCVSALWWPLLLPKNCDKQHKKWTIHRLTHTRTHTQTVTHTHTMTHTRAHTHSHTHAHHSYTHTRTHARTHTHTDTDTHTHTHTHKHTHNTHTTTTTIAIPQSYPPLPSTRTVHCFNQNRSSISLSRTRHRGTAHFLESD